MKKRSSLSARVVRATIATIASAATLGGLASGCLDRPVSPASPNTTNVFVDQIRQSGVDKIDMLFMLDNSISMADKQKILESAVPKLVERLVTPRCVDSGTKAPTTGNFPNCAASDEPEFPPIKDIHLGVITSSLGAHGGDTCSETSPNFKPDQNDKGRLVGPLRGVTNHEGLDFLWWNPDTDSADAADSNTLISEFSAQVVAAGETGCGYEASLEAWYRFLVDPQPPDTVAREGSFTQVLQCPAEGQDCGAGGICIGGFCADKTVLAQRQQFLRGDSLVAVVMLTDENDCSIRDDGQGWLISLASPGLPRSTSACLTNPDDQCCTSCGAPAPGGCADHATDPECSKGVYSGPEDHVNLRCWDQKRRFGVDFLYPIQRYVQALKSPNIQDRSGNDTPNPLFSTGGGVSRDPSLIFLAGIVGVPWQAIATDDSQAPGAPLKYKNARDVDWAAITKSGSTPPTNTHMVESFLPRAGLADFNTPNTDPVHGHDWDIVTAFGAQQGPGDLQYACIFPLAQTRDCSGATGGCDCNAAGVNGKSPLCWDGGQFSSVQHYAKAYPGTRQLEVLRDFGDNAIVASICPKEAVNAGDPSYGYNPAVDAIVDRLKEQLSGSCLTRPVSVTCEGQIVDGVCQGETKTQCAIVEVTPTQGGACGCDPNANRGEPAAKLVKPVLDGLKRDRICGPESADKTDCSQANYCLCEINEANPKSSCENDATPNGIGWCYIDPFGEPKIGSEALVQDCNPKRQLRFIGTDTPKKNSIVFIACLGKPLGE
ncbi:MAG: hypothetical protein R3B13_31055 [Polyangiaceae bacterium]